MPDLIANASPTEVVVLLGVVAYLARQAVSFVSWIWRRKMKRADTLEDETRCLLRRQIERLANAITEMGREISAMSKEWAGVRSEQREKLTSLDRRVAKIENFIDEVRTGTLNASRH